MKKIILGMILMICVAHEVRAQNYEEQPSPGSWKDRTYFWYYNGDDVPAWLDKDKSRDLYMKAAESWKICGIDLKFMGDTNQIPGKMDGKNVVGWSERIPRAIRGLTLGRSKANQLIERDILIQSKRIEFQKSQRLLEKVITHEFGHAIGLTHSKRCDDVMTLAADCPKIDPELLPLNPTENDLIRCREIY